MSTSSSQNNSKSNLQSNRLKMGQINLNGVQTIKEEAKDEEEDNFFQKARREDSIEEIEFDKELMMEVGGSKNLNFRGNKGKLSEE